MFEVPLADDALQHGTCAAAANDGVYKGERTPDPSSTIDQEDDP
ncbi:hypothetical protein P376_4014 [Streptomyces sp. HCCB10043]|nr:hypothetical protein P376_4014 [Streptomyces sp. HCCB10043]